MAFFFSHCSGVHALMVKAWITLPSASSSLSKLFTNRCLANGILPVSFGRYVLILIWQVSRCKRELLRTGKLMRVVITALTLKLIAHNCQDELRPSGTTTYSVIVSQKFEKSNVNFLSICRHTMVYQLWVIHYC